MPKARFWNRFGSMSGNTFWITLGEDLNGLKEAFNGSSNEEGEVENMLSSPSSLSSSAKQQAQQASDLWFVISPRFSMESPCHPTSHQLYTLCETYLTNVDPAFSVLHAPSLHMIHRKRRLSLNAALGLGELKRSFLPSATPT